MSHPRSNSNNFEYARRSSYWRESDARAVLTAWASSGRSLREFAEQHGLQPERLYRWQRRLAQTSTVSFHPVEIVDSRRAVDASSANPHSLELVLRSGHRVMIGSEFDPVLLRRLVETVESWSC